MSVNSLGISVDGADSVHLSASRVDEAACLVIKTDGAHCEIQMDRAVVEALRDQLPATLAGLDRWAAETAACVKAGAVEKRAVDAATRALDLAVVAEQAGDHKLAACLRKAATTASAQAKAVDDAVTAFEEATVDADHATDRLIDILGKAETALDQPRDKDRPAEPVGSGVL
jgi:hypothetical protein